MTTEQQLLNGLKSGDKKAVRNWFLQYHDRLLAVALGKVSIYKDAEELVQETFMNCLKQLPLFRGESSLFTFMNSILRHEVADYYRKKYAKKALKTIQLSDFLVEIIEQSNFKDSSEISEQVKEVMKKMKNQSQELLLSKYLDGKKVAMIAKEMGKSQKSIESELFRAREEFKILWKANGLVAE